MAAHAVGSGGVEAVVAEEAAGGIGGQKLTVEEHGHAVSIPGAKLHIVGHHDDGDAIGLQSLQDACQLFLEEASSEADFVSFRWRGSQDLRYLTYR